MKSNTSPPSRRELQRAGTVADIKAAARVRLVESGPSGISLRAVARDLRVSAPALYRYFPSLDALVTALCVDFYDELIGYMWERCEALPETDVVGRLLAATRSFRVWAVSHRPEFSLMFASTIPGAVTAKPGCHSTELDAEREPYASMLRFSTLFGRLFGQVYAQPDEERGFPLAHPPTPPLTEGLRAELERCSEAIDMRVPVEYAYVFHSFWIRLYGMVSMEVFGQLPVVQEAEALMEAELFDMARQVGAPTI